MRLNLSLSSLVAAIALWPCVASASPSLPLGRDWSLTVHGDLRPRLEIWRDGARDPSDPDWDAVVSQRSRLGTALSHRDGLQLDLTLQDVRTWGRAAADSTDGLQLYTANMALDLGEGFRVVLGRQELEVGHPRLVGNEDFWQRGRAFDAAQVVLDAPLEKASLFYAKLREGSTGRFLEPRTTVTGDRDLGGITSRTTVLTNHEASLLFLVDNDSYHDATRYTLGGLFVGARGPLRYSAEAYGQSGMERDEPVAAYFVGFDAEVTVPRRFSPRLALWLEHASGDGTAQGSFSAPVGSHHEYFGALDLFVDLPHDTHFGGLTDFGAAAGGRPQPWFEMNLDWHCFSSRTSNSQRSFVGQEFDLTATFELGEVVALESLSGIFLPTGKFERLQPKQSSFEPDYEFATFVSLRARF